MNPFAQAPACPSLPADATFSCIFGNDVGLIKSPDVLMVAVTISMMMMAMMAMMMMMMLIMMMVMMAELKVLTHIVNACQLHHILGKCEHVQR
mmetsp:Transcript_118734/g.217531  ORF Transcript_118734/g.217531 Transcript_118734/m.217531 type:complete len:93 (-) Transcript_118734:84-362(-)